MQIEFIENKWAFWLSNNVTSFFFFVHSLCFHSLFGFEKWPPEHTQKKKRAKFMPSTNICLNIYILSNHFCAYLTIHSIELFLFTSFLFNNKSMKKSETTQLNHFLPRVSVTGDTKQTHKNKIHPHTHTKKWNEKIK